MVIPPNDRICRTNQISVTGEENPRLPAVGWHEDVAPHFGVEDFAEGYTMTVISCVSVEHDDGRSPSCELEEPKNWVSSHGWRKGELCVRLRLSHLGGARWDGRG